MDTEETEALLLVDATNAFNTLIRQGALHNVQVTCPAILTILSNTYKAPGRMFVAGGGEITSVEGTAQGDPLAMAMYALAITPLIKRLKKQAPKASQLWFADDSSAAGRLRALKVWWQHLTILGPEFGYFPNASKTTMVVKEEFFDQAKYLFEETGIKITTDGHKILGAACGKRSFVDEYVADKIDEWEKEIEMLSKIAEMYPHAAYTAFTRAIVCKWQYLMRTIDGIGIITCFNHWRALFQIPALINGQRTLFQRRKKQYSLCQSIVVDSTLLILLKSRIFIITHH